MSTQDRVLILHGWGGSDAPHWQAELAAQVAREYGTVSFPLLDNCHFPSKNRWVKQLKGILKDFRPDTVVCHSLANILWFCFCNETEEEIVQLKRLFLVSPPSLSTDIETIKTFFPCTLPDDLHADKIEMIVSDNDPYIKVNEARMMAEHFQISLQVIENAGHINAESGYGKWEYIENLLLEST